MKQWFVNGSPSTVTINANRYNCLTGASAGNSTYNATEAAVQHLIPCSGTLRNFYVSCDSAVTGQPYVWTVRKNTASTALTCTVAVGTTSASDLVNSVSVAAGDVVNVLVFAATGANQPHFRWGCEFQPSSSTQCIAMGGGGNNITNTANGTFYNSVPSVLAWSSTHSFDRKSVLSMNGTIIAFYAGMTAAAGAGSSRSFQLRLNNADQASSLLTLSDPVTSLGVAGLSIAFSAGDTLSIRVDNAAVAPAAARGRWGVVIQPTTDGESPMFSSFSGFDPSAIAPATPSVIPFNSVSTGFSTTNLGFYEQICPGIFSVKNLYVNLDAAGAGSETFAFNIMKNAATSGLGVTFSAGQTSRSDLSNTVSYSATDLMRTQLIINNNFSASTIDANMGMTQFDPAFGPQGAGRGMLLRVGI